MTLLTATTLTHSLYTSFETKNGKLVLHYEKHDYHTTNTSTWYSSLNFIKVRG